MRKTTGIENIPKNKAYIVAPNHSSYADDLIAPYTMIAYGKKKLHIFVNSRFYKNFFLIKLLDHFGCIRVDVSKDVKDEEKRKKTNEKAFKIALEGLKNGDILIIFPEGGRSQNGKLKKAKTGIAKAALAAKVPVLPMGIKGSYEIMPKGAKLPKFKKADIIIGKPMYFDKYYGKEKDYKTLETVTTLIMKEIAKLTNQDYNY
ncbi:MAG: 1-acyl-sn-glycerol-3-phosphate acyltransferase [Nanoarchaeota archaeon]|nr:1-acyl-sn-glycerol-3-phosphate acyltransferase [Nanoarchaeota archaeon]